MSTFFEDLACSHIRDLVPYQSARRIGGHGHNFLNANEAFKSELYMFNSTTLHRYPDCQPLETVTGYADYAGVAHDRVLVSRGSDEAIGLLIRLLCEPHRDGIVIAPPTYGMYAIAARTNMAKVAVARRRDDLRLEAAAVLEAIDGAEFTVKAVFIDSPGNPLGVAFDQEELIRILEARPEVLVVMDEAYIEFCPELSCLPLQKRFRNLVVTRTLSKAFALAGIRCGFVLADPELIRLLLKIIDPYPIPDPVAQISRQAVAEGGIGLMRERVSDICTRREALRAELEKLSCVVRVHPSQANFLLTEFRNGPEVFNYVAQRGIILRSFEHEEALRNCVRITVGSADELNELGKALTAYDGAAAGPA